MNAKQLSAAFLAASLLLLAGCSKKNEDVVTLKFANSQTAEEVCSQEIQAFADRVRERSNGSIEIEVYNDGILGDDNQALESCARGANYITYVDPAAMCYYVPDYSIMMGPYLFNDVSQIKKLAFSEYGDEMVEKAAQSGIRVLDHMSSYYGTRVFISDRPLTTPADMVDTKMRVPSVPLWIQMVEAMGASTTTTAFSEVYTALSQGVIDGMENPIPQIYAGRFHEVAKYLSLTNHIIQPNGIEMSEAVFQSLTEEQQKILEEEAIVFAESVTEKVLKDEKEVREKMAADGVEIVECDLDAYREATKNVYDQFSAEWSSGLYDRVVDIINR